MNDYKIIEGYPDYAVTKEGKVISFKFGKIREMTQHERKGYLSVYLTENSKTNGFLVHRLIAKAFIPNPENKPTINDIDGNKANNDISNLEWSTMSEQALHAYDKGFRNQKGIRNTNCKLSDEDVASIRELYKTGNYFFSTLGKIFGVSPEQISRIVKLKQRR